MSENRIEALRARHASLEDKIKKALKSPGISQDKLTTLKREKLQLKEEIELQRA